MGRRARQTCEERLEEYVEGLAGVIGHADRATPLRDYCTGLLMPAERKSVEPMAAMTAPARSRRSTNRCCISSARRPGRTRGCWPRCASWCCRHRADWADRGLDHRRHRLSQEGPALGRGGAAVLRPAGQAGQLPGGGDAVARQPHGQPAGAYRLYLPQEWADDRCAGAKAGVPEEIAFQTKPEIALDQIRAACEAGLPRGVVLMDAGYGSDTHLRTQISALGLDLCRRHPVEHLGVGARHASRCRPSHGRAGGGRRSRPRRGDEHQPDLGQGAGASALPAGGCGARSTWREGSSGAADLALRARAGARGSSRLRLSDRARRNGC